MTDDIQDKSQDNDQTDGQDSWLTVAEAVQVTGKSDKTIRRWVSANKVAHKRESGRIYIKLSSLELANRQTGQVSDQSRQIKLDVDMVELTRLRTENQRLAEENQRLYDLLLNAMAKIPAIEAGPVQPTKSIWTRIKELFKSD
jgi:hypothetical protein